MSKKIKEKKKNTEKRTTDIWKDRMRKGKNKTESSDNWEVMFKSNEKESTWASEPDSKEEKLTKTEEEEEEEPVEKKDTPKPKKMPPKTGRKSSKVNHFAKGLKEKKLKGIDTSSPMNFGGMGGSEDSSQFPRRGGGLARTPPRTWEEVPATSPP